MPHAMSNRVSNKIWHIAYALQDTYILPSLFDEFCWDYTFEISFSEAEFLHTSFSPVWKFTHLFLLGGMNLTM